MVQKLTFIVLTFVFSLNSVSFLTPEVLGAEFFLPQPGAKIMPSAAFTPAYLKGMTIDVKNPFKFDFIVFRGDRILTDADKNKEYTTLIKYFLAALAVPDQNQWVNLSPYEKNRIISPDFGRTQMGRDLLGEDYILKQFSSSLTDPESQLGREFWSKVYKEAGDKFGTTAISVNTFNKVWIVPDKAVVYEKGNTVYVLENHLKVMMEEDYLSLKAHSFSQGQALDKMHVGSSRIIKELIIPSIEKEVNTGKNFAKLRQIYSGMLLATWYKRTLKESLLGKLYANKGKVQGINQDPKVNQEIYNQYLRAFKKGVFNMIKEEIDPQTQQVVARKYFSGGTEGYDKAQIVRASSLPEDQAGQVSREDIVGVDLIRTPEVEPDAAMVNFSNNIALGIRLANALLSSRSTLVVDRTIAQLVINYLLKLTKDKNLIRLERIELADTIVSHARILVFLTTEDFKKEIQAQGEYLWETSQMPNLSRMEKIKVADTLLRNHGVFSIDIRRVPMKILNGLDKDPSLNQDERIAFANVQLRNKESQIDFIRKFLAPDISSIDFNLRIEGRFDREINFLMELFQVDDISHHVEEQIALIDVFLSNSQAIYARNAQAFMRVKRRVLEWSQEADLTMPEKIMLASAIVQHRQALNIGEDSESEQVATVGKWAYDYLFRWLWVLDSREINPVIKTVAILEAKDVSEGWRWDGSSSWTMNRLLEMRRNADALIIEEQIVLVEAFLINERKEADGEEWEKDIREAVEWAKIRFKKLFKDRQHLTTAQQILLAKVVLSQWHLHRVGHYSMWAKGYLSEIWKDASLTKLQRIELAEILFSSYGFAVPKKTRSGEAMHWAAETLLNLSHDSSLTEEEQMAVASALLKHSKWVEGTINERRKWARDRLVALSQSPQLGDLEKVRLAHAMIEIRRDWGRGDRLTEQEEQEHKKAVEWAEDYLNAIKDRSSDAAMNALAAPGGIDMNPANLNLQIKRDSHGTPLSFSQQDVEKIHINGLTPVIRSITPAESLSLF